MYMCEHVSAREISRAASASRRYLSFQDMRTSQTHLKGENGMKPRLNVITLAVNDLEKSFVFYRDGLGLPTKGIIATEFKGTETEPAGAVVFFELQGGLIFALYPRKELAKDARVPSTAASSLEFSLGSTVGSRKGVDELLEKAQAAGGTVMDKPLTGHLLRVFQGSRWALVGDHLGSEDAN